MIPKAVIIKLKFLKETHTVTKISEDSETVFYIYFLICNKTKNKQLPISKLLALNFSFYHFTPTIDKEPLSLLRQPLYTIKDIFSLRVPKPFRSVLQIEAGIPHLKRHK